MEKVAWMVLTGRLGSRPCQFPDSARSGNGILFDKIASHLVILDSTPVLSQKTEYMLTQMDDRSINGIAYCLQTEKAQFSAVMCHSVPNTWDKQQRVVMISMHCL